MSNIIKALQCINSRMREAKLPELVSSQKHNEPAGIPTVHRDTEQSQEAILQGALEQAKNIVGNTHSYAMNQLRESTAQMNEETSHIKAAGYQEGFFKGSAESFERGHSEGYEEGYEQGLQEGREAGVQELQGQSDRQRVEIAWLTEDLGQNKLRVLEGFRSGIEVLSMQIAHKILHQEASNGTTVPAIVSGVLEEYHDQEWACIHTSPRAAELLRANPQLMECLQSVSRNLHIVPSASLEDLDRQIDLPDRQLDTGIETQLKGVSYELRS